jgi:hypothetical protein
MVYLSSSVNFNIFLTACELVAQGNIFSGFCIAKDVHLAKKGRIITLTKKAWCTYVLRKCFGDKK